MSESVIKIENVSKLYKLGEIGTGTISHDLNRFIAKVRGKEDPFQKVGQVNDRTQEAIKGESIWALKDINFEVKQGEVLGIIGKNGAGKSTLLKLLSRVTSPTTGSIKVKGRLVSLLEVGTGFHPEMTGRENIYMNGTIMGMRRWEIDKKLDEIVEFAGVAKYLDTPTKRYSSGMTVRLGFAIAAFLEPDILVVDEALAVGDAEFQKKAIGKMQDVSQGEGRTVLFVSHNMASIKSLCTRALLLHNGEVNFIGDTEEVISKYLKENTRISNIELISRKDRQGNNQAILQKYWFNDLELNSKIDTLVSGKSVEIIMEFLNRTSDIIPNVEMAIGVFTTNEQLLFICSSSFQGTFYNFETGTNIVKIVFEKWPTSSGQYFLNFFAKNHLGITDWIQNAGQFEVENGDYYGFGKTVPLNAQSTLVNFSYKKLK